MNWEELYKKYSKPKKKKIFPILLVIVFSTLFFLFILYYFSLPEFIEPQAEIVSDVITLPSIKGEHCTIYITGPNNIIKLFSEYDCSEYQIFRFEILDLFSDIKGRYKLVVVSDSGNNLTKNFLVV
ncbi:MAG: hypothetical protein QXU40_02350 [Candidatus Pacearchaeota archaeon]